MILLLPALIPLYIAVIAALIIMFTNYKKDNWIWLALLAASFLIGIAPIVAIVYLVLHFTQEMRGDKTKGVVYRTDGNYEMYSADQAKKDSQLKLAFKIVVGIILGGLVAFGLLIVSVFVLLILFPPKNAK